MGCCARAVRRMVAVSERPYSSEELAEHWGCSAQHIRDLVRSGALRSFRVGRLIRIPAIAVDEFEKCPPIAPSSTAENTTPSGPTNGAQRRERRFIPRTAR